MLPLEPERSQERGTIVQLPDGTSCLVPFQPLDDPRGNQAPAAHAREATSPLRRERGEEGQRGWRGRRGQLPMAYKPLLDPYFLPLLRTNKSRHGRGCHRGNWLTLHLEYVLVPAPVLPSRAQTNTVLEPFEAFEIPLVATTGRAHQRNHWSQSESRFMTGYFICPPHGSLIVGENDRT